MHNGRYIVRIALLAGTLLLGIITAFAQEIQVIPEPVKWRVEEGAFVFYPETKLFLSDQKILSPIASYFSERLYPATGIRVLQSEGKEGSAIQLTLNQQHDPLLGKEGYHLQVTPKGVNVSANYPSGIFYGIQTLLQLMPAEVESRGMQQATWSIPEADIVDYPRFAWRGIMLDVSRHFFSKDYVKEYIDQISRYKYNRLHLHLTDDNGWRIEIKSLPKLTSVGAWRVPRTGTFGSNTPPKPGEKATYGGFYTQEDIREIVAFAKERFIEIIPEIDVPGHSMAAIASYPYLSVTKDTTTRVNPGSKFSTWHGSRQFTMHVDNTLNPADEKVDAFLEKVVSEVATLFPFEYIHMGGDECYKGFWERDPNVQVFMKKNKIRDGRELQSYFTNRVNKIVSSKGKKMIGWDEIIEGPLSDDAAVMSWQGTEGGIKASKLKHTVVMSPAPRYYLDMVQGEPSIEPRVYDASRLKETYEFNIVPPEADTTFIIGGQGNLWTEQIPTTRQVEYMTYPRAFAIAETLWSPKAKKDWACFIKRTEKHFSRLDEAQVNYATSIYDPILTVSKNSAGNIVVELSTEVSGLDLFYTIDNAVPNHYHPKYSGPVELTEDVDNFRVISYRDNKPKGRLISLSREELAKRIKRKP